MDPVLRILNYEKEGDEIIVIETDEEEEEELDDDVFVVVEMENLPVIHPEEGELEEMAAETEEDLEWEKSSDQELHCLPEHLEAINMEEELEQEDITDEELHHISEQFDDNMEQCGRILAGSLMMVVRALCSLYEVVTDNCEGCINGYGGQLDHLQCVWMSWKEKVDMYFSQAMEKLTDEVLLSFFQCIYPVGELFDSESDVLFEALFF